MSNPNSSVSPRRALFGRRNVILFAVAALTLVAGYALLKGGSASLAAVLLVLGYCVLFPLAIAL
jgi:hypothetical protein